MQLSLGEKNGKKTPVYIDGELLGCVYPNDIKVFRWTDEDEISEPDFRRLKDEIIVPRAKRYVMNLLVKSDKTEAELKRKLKQAGYGEEVSENAIEYVRGFHYIDELRTATGFIRAKMDSSSEKEIRYKLAEKGVSEDTIDMAYDQISEENPEEVNTELKACENFLRRKLGGRLFSDDELAYEERQKLCAAAYRKGFRQDSIREALKLIKL